MKKSIITICGKKIPLPPLEKGDSWLNLSGDK